jgi:CDP-diacylglycerol--serine O-phosphatidyltransferase
MKKHIPNLVTLLNLFCGSLAAVFVIQGHLVWGAVFVFFGIFFDFMDGLLARVLDARSDLGLQLDSLADVVTSGLVPGLVLYKLLALSLNIPDEMIDPGQWTDQDAPDFRPVNLIPLLGLLIPMASAYRLGKFNLDEEQQQFFKGLPTPANALLIMSLPLILEFQNSDVMNAQILNPYVLVVLTLISAYLLNAPIKLFSLKFKSFDFASNILRYLFILICVVLLLLFKFASIPLIILLYVLMSLGNQKQLS